NDAQRFVKIGCWSDDGTEATKKTASLDQEIIDKEERFDGFYAICTNLEDNATEIIKVNSWRWEIEDFFRILKTEFEARPVYLRREDRIIAHFITCFISLLIFKLLKIKTGKAITVHKLRETLIDMNFLQVKGEGYIPEYTPSAITDKLHEQAAFRTDYQLITNKEMKNILKHTKSKS
ncbi:MAG: transposase, partial [Muribaculaceae bacterium]